MLNRANIGRCNLIFLILPHICDKSWLRPHSHWNRAEPSETELNETNRAERATIHIASRAEPSQAEPNRRQCSWQFWTARMSKQVYIFSLTDNILWRSLVVTQNRRVWVPKRSARRQSFGKFHNLPDDIYKNEERFRRYLRMNSNTFAYVLELIHVSIKKQNSYFRRSIRPEGRLCTDLRQ